MRKARGRWTIHAKNRTVGPAICTPGPWWETHGQAAPVVGPGDSPLGPHPENHKLNAYRWQERRRGWGGSRATRDFVSWWEKDGTGSGSGGRRHRFAGEAVSQDH